MEVFENAFGSFELERTPGRTSALRGWSAADELTLATLATPPTSADGLDAAGPTVSSGPIVVVNPGAGAVAIALAASGAEVVLVGDSYLDTEATLANAEHNGLDRTRFTVVEPEELVTLGAAALVVVNIPKRLALLEAQLAALQDVLASRTRVIGSGMTRHIHTSTVEAFERYVGATVTTRATKKARLILSTVDGSADAPPVAAPTVLNVGELRVVSESTTFSPRRVDAGTALLLDHLGALGDLDAYRQSAVEPLRVADVGCGNGILGASILARVNDVELTMVDESYAAVRSARATLVATFGTLDPEPIVVAGDALVSFADIPVPEPGSLDVVLTNPPFHHEHAVTDEIAWSIFTSARRALRPGGMLVVVGNRHLGYHNKLRKLFGSTQAVASDPKFVVLSAHKPADR